LDVEKMAIVAMERAHEVVAITCTLEMVGVIVLELFRSQETLFQIVRLQDWELVLPILLVTGSVP
jgi:hypothetical protein